MTSTDNQLFTAEEALSRLSETREQGCLLVHKGAEMIQIHVRDGFVVHAAGSNREGAAAVDQALHLSGSSYSWLRSVQPPQPESELRLPIIELLLRHGALATTKATETGRIAVNVAKKENLSQYRYFLIPRDDPTSKLHLTKHSTVLGRDKSSDLPIDHNDVSRRHCLLDIQSRGLYVLDLDSSNGTFINGILVREGYVGHGDLIELGPCGFTVNREQMEK